MDERGNKLTQGVSNTPAFLCSKHKGWILLHKNMCIKGIPRVPGILEPSFSSQTVLTFNFNLHAFIMLMVLFLCQLAGVYIRKAVKFLLKQGHLQPHFHSKARQSSTQL